MEIKKTDSMGIRGHFEAKLFDKDGNLKDYRSVPNVMTNVGRDCFMAQGFNTSAGSAQFDYVAIGSGVNAAAASDTALGSEAVRQEGAYTHTDGQHAFQLTETFAAAAGTGSITESGILNASSAGQLFARQVFAVINKGASDSLQVTWTGSIT